ncbi:MAG: TolC family protein, partial [Pseudomonadota bacterium]|nr:TolC family protein [Pseudomonadota bacterium]
VAQAADLALNTLGTAASTYFQLLLTRDKIEAAQQNVANAEAIGNIAQARVNAGVAVPIEALQQQIAIERERNNLRSLIQNDLATRASLALLQGRGVQGFDVMGQTLQTIEVPTVQPGLPSELLFRRPDLVQAEAALRSSNANVAIVRTDLFPQISLTGGVNASSTSLSELVSSPDNVLQISASLVQTLLDNGQRFRNIEQARLGMENTLANYRRSVLGAFNEVEVLLSNIQLLDAQSATALSNLNAAEESFRIAQVRYEEGVADYQTVLQSQNTLFSSRNAWLDTRLLQLNAAVGLYQALGGGWEAPSN